MKTNNEYIPKLGSNGRTGAAVRNMKSESSIRSQVLAIANRKKTEADNNETDKRDVQPNKRRTILIIRRKELGLTQRELAEALDVNINTICSLETKLSYDPRLSLVKKVCEAFDDTVENLFFREMTE